MGLRRIRSGFFFTQTVAACAVLLLCIQRDNEWDPYNGCHPSEVQEIAKLFQHQIDSVTNSITGRINDLFSEAWNKCLLRIDTNNIRKLNNDTALRRIDSLLSVNRRIEEENRLVNNCDSIKLKFFIGPLTLQRMQMAEIDTLSQSEIGSAKAFVNSLIERARDTCRNQAVLADGYVDSVRRSFSVPFGWDTLLDTIRRYNARMADYNRTINIDSIIHMVYFHDSVSRRYNDSLDLCRLPWIKDTAGIQHRIDAVRPGETIAIDLDSVHIPDALLKRKGLRGVWTVIKGKPSAKTIITSPRMEIDSSFNLKFVDIVFAKMGNDIGARVINSSDSIMFSGCIFRDNARKGLEAFKCRNLIIDNCIFARNGSGPDSNKIGQCGMRLSECTGAIVADNILVVRNIGIGIEINKSFVSISRGTISDNTIDGVRYMGPTGTGSFTAKSSIFSYNGGYGVFRNNEQTTQDVFVSSGNGNRFFENKSGALGGDPNLELNNPPESADPMFINRKEDNYRIGTESPLFGKGIGYCYP